MTSTTMIATRTSAMMMPTTMPVGSEDELAGTEAAANGLIGLRDWSTAVPVPVAARMRIV